MSFPTSPKLLLLAVTSSVVGVLLVVAQEHICSSIMSGNFKEMQICSITFDTDTKTHRYGDAKALLIFQSYNRLYSVPMNDIKEDHMNLTNVPVGSYNIDDRFVRAYKMIRGDRLEKLYHFRKRADDERKDYVYLTHGYMMFTERDNQIHLYREFENPDSLGNIDFKETWNVTQDKFPKPITLVHNQKGRTCHTYAINRDIYDGSGDYVIYQVWMNSPDYKPEYFQVRDPPDEMKKANETSRFYYLEITNDSSVAKLVHRKNVHNRQLGAQMFSSLPHGFLHRDSDEMYLFDMDLGCVYHFTEWREEKLWERWADGQDIVTKRKNYPFEEYFQCDPVKFPKQKHFPHKRERCNTTISNHIYTTSQTSTTTAKYSELTSATVKPSVHGLVISGVGVLILLVIIGLICVVKKGKCPKRSNKSGRSKSSPGVKSLIKSGGKSCKMSPIASSTPSKPKPKPKSVVYKIPSNVKSSSITAKSTTSEISIRSKTEASASSSSRQVKSKKM